MLSGEEGAEDILLTCAVPENGKVVEDNAPLCKIQLMRSVLDPNDRNRLGTGTAAVIDSIDP